jgi:guanosine-3',5'-bis(diphosphate) 3'-pyrophosphohydrolase
MDEFPGVEMRARRDALVRDALGLAREVHEGELREVGDDVPFVHHPLAVAELLDAECDDPTLVAAGLLHDALEYTDLGLVEIRERFGVDVAAIVFALSEDMEIDDLEERRRDLRERVVEAGRPAQRVFAADKIANVMAVREAYAELGEDVGYSMPVDLDRQILLWEHDMERLMDVDESAPLVERLADELIGLWAQRAAAGATGAL